MSSILDNAVKHFTESAGDALYEIEVSEWESSVWFKPVSSMNGMQYQKYFAAAVKQDYESLVDVLILRARSESGTKMFTPADRKALMGKVSPEVVTSIVNRMSAVDNAESDEVKKARQRRPGLFLCAR